MEYSTYKEIVEKIRCAIDGSRFEGHVFVVGGALRSIYLNEDIKDIDICVDLPEGGIKLAQYLEEEGYTSGSIVTYPTYGTAMFRLSGILHKFEIEAVNARKEQYKDPSVRNPETEFGTIEEDAFRRDLTINALYYDISNRKELDPTGKGFSDMERHILSSPNENKAIVYEEDPLRILRLVRYYCRTSSINSDWKIDIETYIAAASNVKRLNIITNERIRDEFNKILMTPKCVEGIKMLVDLGAMEYIIPEIVQMIGVEQNSYHFGDVYQHTLMALRHIVEYVNTDSLNVRLAALLHDVGKLTTRTVGEDGRVHFYEHEFAAENIIRNRLSYLRYPNKDIDEICFYAKWHMYTKQWKDDCSHMKDKSLRKLQYLCSTVERFSNLLRVIDADNCSHAYNHCLRNQIGIILSRTIEMQKEGTTMFDYKLPIDGNDIMELTGQPAGPIIKKYLDHAIKLAYNNPLRAKEQFLKELKNFKP